MKYLTLFAFSCVMLSCSATASSAPENWATLCAKCHGVRGKGDTCAGAKLHVRDYTDAAAQASVSDEQMIKSIVEGMVVNGKGKMRAYPELSLDEVKELVAHMRKFQRSPDQSHEPMQALPKST